MIEKLDEPTRAKLRSTQILTSLPQIISELVQNSLDAGATSVEVGVDCEEWYCWVKDNGSGISKDGLNRLGQGQDEGRYSSSKSYDCGSLDYLSTFGFRGEALASAANLCCLEISSRTINSRDTWSIILKGGQNLYSGPAVRWRRETPGTVVCIRDTFYNLPVRRSSHTPPARTLELIRQEIETYALVFPQVTFTIEDVDKDREGSFGAKTTKGRIVKINKSSSTLAAFKSIFGKALAEHVEEINTSLNGLTLSGFISLNGAHSKAYQYIYVNRHPIVRDDFHRAIDSVFSQSTFGKNALDEIGETGLPRSQIRRSPRKAERRPVYVLDISIPPAELDNCMEPAKAHIQFQNKNKILNFLVSTIKNFLVKHGFNLQSHTTPASRSGTPTRKKHRGLTPEADSLQPTHAPPFQRDHVVDWDNCNEVADSNQVTWTDSMTGEVFIIDRDSGNSRPYQRATSYMMEDIEETGIPVRRTLRARSELPNNEEPDVPDWLRKALSANKNYQAPQENVLDLGPSSCGQDGVPRGVDMSGFDGTSLDHLNLDKLDLSSAQVICQVDRKFIACLLNTEGETILALVDQHAADERVRVEQFLRDLCSGFLNSQSQPSSGCFVEVRNLDPPVPVLLSEHEGRTLGDSKQLRHLLLGWGFSVRVQEDNSKEADVGSGYTQAWVGSIPEVVAEKLLLGKELQDTIKGFIAQIETQLPLPLSAGQKFSWVKALRWCPRELVELVNSKACRGAIMFNDTLTHVQCKKLIEQLSMTAFPFQCAHGRPSMIPLTDLSAAYSQRNKDAVSWTDWAKTGQD